MSNVETIRTLEDLNQFLNESGVMEVVVRQKNKRIKAFQKVVISNLAQEKEGQLTKKAVNALSSLTNLSERNLNLLGSVAKLEGIGLLLNGLNVCATCAGFAIVCKKLSDMSEQITQKIGRLQSAMAHGHDIHNEFEFNKALADHTDMLDGLKTGRPYSESKMRELVDREYNALMLLINTFQKDVSDDHGTLIFSIFSLLSMFTVSLRGFDELYFFNNRQSLSDADIWHLSHDKWMGVYDVPSTSWFVEKLQDYGSFETRLSTLGVDVYCASLLDQAADLKEEVEDNQRLIVAMDDLNLFSKYKEFSSQDVADSIEAAYREAGLGLDEEAVITACQDAMHHAAMA